MTAALRLKIQIACGTEIAMGPGKADLLDAIEDHGSISAAARAIAMSYRRAWLLVDCMNRCWREPLVATAPGLAQGRGASITPFGRAILADYRQLQGQLAAASTGSAYTALARALRDQPRSSQKG